VITALGQCFQLHPEQRTFLKPLIVMELADGQSVLDGNHRVSAFCGLQKMPEESFTKLGLKKPAEEQDVWVGTHSDGEVPLD
jgi:hypothetical protein